MFPLSFHLVGLCNREGLASLCSRSTVCVYCLDLCFSLAWKHLLKKNYRKAAPPPRPNIGKIQIAALQLQSNPKHQISMSYLGCLLSIPRLRTFSSQGCTVPPVYLYLKDERGQPGSLRNCKFYTPPPRVKSSLSLHPLVILILPLPLLLCVSSFFIRFQWFYVNLILQSVKRFTFLLMIIKI